MRKNVSKSARKLKKIREMMKKSEIFFWKILKNALSALLGEKVLRKKISKSFSPKFEIAF